MAYQQSDLDKLDAAIVSGIKSVTLADGRKTEWQSAAELRAIRADMKAEIAASASRVRPRTRFIVGQVARR